MLRRKDKVTITFETPPGKTTGEIFDVRLLVPRKKVRTK